MDVKFFCPKSYKKNIQIRALKAKLSFSLKNTLKVVNEGELLDIAQNVSETKGSFDQNQLMLDIEKVLRDCEMDRENFKFM